MNLFSGGDAKLAVMKADNLSRKYQNSPNNVRDHLPSRRPVTFQV
jgi:hypothetical protein